jgi:hypothetical protein
VDQSRSRPVALPTLRRASASVFVECEAVFDGPMVAWDDDRATYGELRINLLGWLRG